MSKKKDNQIIWKTVDEFLNNSIKRIEKKQQTPQLEARAVFQNLNMMAMSYHIKFSEKEYALLNKIEKSSQSIWSGINSYNASNMWPNN